VGGRSVLRRGCREAIEHRICHGNLLAGLRIEGHACITIIASDGRQARQRGGNR
jgi:hypothetical protein